MFNKTDAEHKILCGKLTAPPSLLRVTSASNGLPAVLTRGMYRVVSTCDAWIRQCNATMTVATSNASFLGAGTREYLACENDGDTNVVGITDGGSGYVHITRLI